MQHAGSWLLRLPSVCASRRQTSSGQCSSQQAPTTFPVQVGEVDRARAIYVHASSLSDPRNDPGFWKDWNDFEVRRAVIRPWPPCATARHAL